ncbi:substrate-binding domain-containing protein [Paenibacillus hexagrammi]|uniref:Substrate-binding domain-containing protein n=1 Tax=Paenibacillus hexagrammi TaxID=2908839 RepID=A0ABY3SR77_9BACL|nr:substrate-binding domain-containing protein [Paenibacillus sp. YPD9-1]UJF36377.1 substrate-binding domain-containing protein [Paenibacillus sp. YPD9-1]
MKNKRNVMGSLVAATVMLALVAGCGTNQTTAPAATAAPTKAAEKPADNGGAAKTDDNKKIVVGFSQIGAESGWRGAETQSIQDTAKNDPSIELKFSDAQQKQENQIKAIRSFIAQKVDVIAMAPVVETGWEQVLTEAKQAKIPVILVDRGIDKKNEDLYTSFIGSDFIQEGQNAAKELAKLIGEDKKANIVELEGTGAQALQRTVKKALKIKLRTTQALKL